MGISQADADEIKRLTIKMLRCFESQMLHGDKKLEPGPSERLFTFVDSLTFEPPTPVAPCSCCGGYEDKGLRHRLCLECEGTGFRLPGRKPLYPVPSAPGEEGVLRQDGTGRCRCIPIPTFEDWSLVIRGPEPCPVHPVPSAPGEETRP